MLYQGLNLRKIKTNLLADNILNNRLQVPSKTEKKELSKTTKIAFEKTNYLLAINCLTIGLYYDTKNTIQTTQKSGLLRYSRYVGKRCIVPKIAHEILSLNNRLSFLSTEHIHYFESILNLNQLESAFKELQLTIINGIKSFEKKYKGSSLFKSLLVFADYLFLIDHYPLENNDLVSINGRGKEDLCAGISYLIYFLSKYKPLKVKDTLLVSEDFIDSGEINQLIIASCLINDFKEFEILIDHFNYKCIQKDGVYKICPPSPDFEKSIRLGYIRSQIQNSNDTNLALQDIDENHLSILQLVNEVIERENLVLFKVANTHGYLRYRIEIPEPLYNFIVDTFFKSDLLFKEEVVYLSKIFKEQLLNPQNLDTIKVKDELTLMEFLKIQRVFTLLFLFFKQNLERSPKKDVRLILRSLIPIQLEDAFYNLIKKLTSAKNIDSFLDITCWEPGMNILFDLQYHPLLFIEGRFMIPLSIMANSNSIRNLYASEYKKGNANLFTNGVVDGLVEKLELSFKSKKIICHSQVPLPKSDLDLCAIFDRTLFVFECKQSLHPVSSFDLRTTYDYIKKAEAQLDYINHLYESGDLDPIFKNRFGINLKSIDNVISCIVLSNRMFNGNVFKYPVRNINEIENLLGEGILRTDEGEFHIWRGTELSCSDLENYFGSNSALIDLMFDSLSASTSTYSQFSNPIEFETYHLDPAIAQAKLKKFTSNLKKVQSP